MRQKTPLRLAHRGCTNGIFQAFDLSFTYEMLKQNSLRRDQSKLSAKPNRKAAAKSQFSALLTLNLNNKFFAAKSKVEAPDRPSGWRSFHFFDRFGNATFR
jgi:hypothetical protein